MKRLGFCAALALTISPASAAEDKACPARRNEVDFKLAAFVADRPIPHLSTLLRAGAIVAVQSIPVLKDVEQIDRAIRLETPVKAYFPAGTLIGTQTFEGVSRRCVYRPGAFQPPHDDKDRAFPTNCLEDNDHDGRFETMRLFAYGGMPGDDMLVTAIPPVRLEKASDPRAAMTVHLRARVLSVSGNQATFAMDAGFAYLKPTYMIGPDGLVEQPLAPPSEPEWYTPPILTRIVDLKEGVGTIAGLGVEFVNVAGAWSATPTGDFASWLTAKGCDGSRLIISPPRATD